MFRMDFIVGDPQRNCTGENIILFLLCSIISVPEKAVCLVATGSEGWEEGHQHMHSVGVINTDSWSVVALALEVLSMLMS